MKKYEVNVPIAGYVCIEVEAESIREAIEKAFEKGWTQNDIIEIDMYDKVVEGNVCYLWHNQVEVIELESDEE